MADNVAITAGSGTSIATDDETGVHYQKIKIADGTSGSTAMVAGDATNGLDVDVTRIIPGTSATHLGKAIDSVPGATDTGVAALVVRDDALSTLTPVDGDYTVLRVDSTGRTWTTAVLEAGSAAIGKLAANTGVDIGDVDVTTVVPGTGATQLGKAVDGVAGATDTGVLLLAVRDDALSTLTPADGDYTQLRVSSTGALHVTGSAGTTQYADGAVWGAGQSGVECLAVRKDTGAAFTGVADGDMSPLQVTATGNLRVSIAEDTIGSTVDTEDGTIATGQSNVALTAGLAYEYDGTNWVRLRGPHSVAHDAADAGNPSKLGAKATTALSAITAVTSGDRTDLYSGADGVLIVRSDTVLEDIAQDRATNTDGASTAFAGGLAAPGAGIRHWIKTVTIANSSSSFCTVDLRDGSAGSVLWTFPVPATGGVTHVFDPPLRLTANTALAYDASAATSTLTISANGFKSKL